MLTCESCGRGFEKNVLHQSSRFCQQCSIGRCPKCEDPMPLTRPQCKFMGHEEICPSCGYCKDCEKYEKELARHEAMIRDPEYYFEPWDELDTPESRVPRKPVERFDVFPSGSHQIERISEPEMKLKGDEGHGKFYLVQLTMVVRSEFSEPIGGGHRFVGTDSFEIPFAWAYYPEEEMIRPGGKPYFNEFWKHIEKCYTKAALDKLLDELFENHVRPFLDMMISETSYIVVKEVTYDRQRLNPGNVVERIEAWKKAPEGHYIAKFLMANGEDIPLMMDEVELNPKQKN